MGIQLSYLDGEKLRDPKGWLNPLARDGGFVPFREGDRTVIANLSGEWAPGDRCLVTGDYLWRNYSVQASVRLISFVTLQTNDHERGLPPRAGLILRYRTLRHYYFYCLEVEKVSDDNFMEGYLALYHRWDDTWDLLARRRIRINPWKYYLLEAELKEDRIRCFLDDRLAFRANDERIDRGKAGIRSNAESRFQFVRVSSDREGIEEFERERRRREEELRRIRERYPKPVLYRRIDISEFGSRPINVRFAHVRGAEKLDMILIYGRRAVALSGEGEMLWNLEFPEEWGRTLHCCDIDADGIAEVVTLVGGELVVIDPTTGEYKARRGFPKASTFEGGVEGTLANPYNAVDPIYIANFLGDQTRQILLKGGAYHGAWAFDHNLEPLWEMPNVKYGHHLDCYDVDGDGREEAIVGHAVINAEGKVISLTEGIWRRTQPYHADRPIAADIDIDNDPENGPEIAMVCGNLGFLLVDSFGRVISEVPVGHAQTLSVGKFRKDLPGLQIWTCTRWGNYGIRTLFDCRGRRIFEWEPDNGEDAGRPCNWTGDGEELTFRNSSPNARGLYDAWGRCVVEFPKSGGSPVGPADVTGDPRDELIFLDEEHIYIYTQDREFKGNRIYAPVRKHHQSQGLCSLPRWLNLETGEYERPPAVHIPHSPVKTRIRFPRVSPPSGMELISSLDPSEFEDGPFEVKRARRWVNPLHLSGNPWGILTDGNRKVLCNLSDSVGPHDACLITGDERWRDYVVEANVRVVSTLTIPSSWGPGRYVVLDEQYDRTPRAGLIFRYRHLRRYCWFGIEVPPRHRHRGEEHPSTPPARARLVLYDRRDNLWRLLASKGINFSPDRYYHLRVETEGDRIKCYLNGSLTFDLADAAISPRGKAGVRTNTEAWFSSIEVWISDEERERVRTERRRESGRRSRRRREFPKPKPICEIVLEGDPKSLMPLRSSPPLITVSTEEGLRAFNLEGEEVWRSEIEAKVPLASFDVDGDGRIELVTHDGDHLILVEGETGLEKRKVELKGEVSALYADRDFIVALANPFWGAWGFSGALEMLWHRPDLLHGGSAFIEDIDGDREKEVIIGFTALKRNGHALWYMPRPWYRVAPFAPRAIGVIRMDERGRRKHIVMACAKAGLIFMRENGRIIGEIPAGDVRSLCTGRFFPEGEGVWICTWWGNYGIRRLYRMTAEMTSIEPNNIPFQPYSVRWVPGLDLMLDTSGPDAIGLYDSEGVRVVRFDLKDRPDQVAVEDLNGDGLDEVILSLGRRIVVYGPELMEA
jgi:outer membrane protein assembly factor BamB